MVVGNIYLIAAVSIIGGGLFGFDISSMSAIIGTDQYKCYFNQSGSRSCEGPKPSVQGGITASMAGGSWLGALVSGFVSDNLGRKKAIMLGALVWYAIVASPLSRRPL
jgi:MFS family permease